RPANRDLPATQRAMNRHGISRRSAAGPTCLGALPLPASSWGCTRRYSARRFPEYSPTRRESGLCDRSRCTWRPAETTDGALHIASSPLVACSHFLYAGIVALCCRITDRLLGQWLEVGSGYR